MHPELHPVCRVAPDLHEPIERAIYTQLPEKIPNSDETTVLDYWATAGVVILDVAAALTLIDHTYSGEDRSLAVWRADGKPTVLLYRPADTWDGADGLYRAAHGIGATHVLPHSDWDDNHAADAWADFLASLVRDYC
jgi:hypothetical protein